MSSEGLRAVAEFGNLWAAWEQVRLNRAAAGLDGVSVERVAADPEPLLGELRRELLSGRYRPWPVRRAWLPKHDGSRRPIGIGTVRDRIAQRAALAVLGPRSERRFNAGSFAYRPGRGLQDAVEALEHHRDAGYRAVLETDIEACFESLDHQVLERAIAALAPEPDLQQLLHRWLHAGVVDRGRQVVPERGVSQGDVLSPLLCNLYLDPLDDALERFSGRLVRYADDLVVVCRTPRGAARALQHVEAELRELRLEVNRDKTRVTDFDAGFVFLGVEFRGDLAIPLSHHLVLRGDGRTALVGAPSYELPLPHQPPPPEGRLNRRLEHLLNHQVARGTRRGRRITTMAAAFREALAQPDDPDDEGIALL